MIEPAPASSQTAPSLYRWFWPFLIGFLVIDLATKADIFASDCPTADLPPTPIGLADDPAAQAEYDLVIRHLRLRDREACLQEAWQDIPMIRPSFNTGVAWSLFAEHPEWVVMITVVMIPLLIFAFWRWFRHGGRLEVLAFGSVLGGALGNAWDRLWSLDPVASGIFGVRDFIHVDLTPIPFLDPFPTFNVADIGISVGFIALLLVSFRKPGPQPPTGDQVASASGPHTETRASPA